VIEGECYLLFGELKTHTFILQEACKIGKAKSCATGRWRTSASKYGSYDYERPPICHKIHRGCPFRPLSATAQVCLYERCLNSWIPDNV